MALPTELLSAINTAASQYGVDPNYLIRIWAWESGSTFPNPAVNSSNYGGLFGLGQGTDYGAGPVNNYDTSSSGILNQAQSAAAELARLMQQNGGSVYNAMLAYSGGSTNEASFVSGGNNPASYTQGVNTVQTSGGPVIGSGSTSVSQIANSSGSPSFVTTLNPTQIPGDIANSINNLLKGLANAPSNAAGAVAANTIGAFLGILQKFVSSGAYLDPLFVLFGLAIVLVSILGLVTGKDPKETIIYAAKNGAKVAAAE